MPNGLVEAGSALVRWSVRHRGTVALIAAVAALTVCLVLISSWKGSRPTSLLALDRQGHRIWDVHLSALSVNGVTPHGKTLGLTATAEIRSCVYGRRAFSVDSASGRVLKTRNPRDAQFPGPRVDDGETRYAASFIKGDTGSVEVAAADLATRKVRWQRTFAMTELPEIGAGDGVVVLTPYAGGVVVLDGTSGATLWELAAGPRSAVAGGGDGRVYVATRGRVEARDSHTGAVQWRVHVSLNGRRYAIAPVASDADVVAVGNPTRLRVYDHAGDPLYSVSLTSPPGAVFVESGRIYVNYGGRSSRGCD